MILRQKVKIATGPNALFTWRHANRWFAIEYHLISCLSHICYEHKKCVNTLDYIFFQIVGEMTIEPFSYHVSVGAAHD